MKTPLLYGGVRIREALNRPARELESLHFNGAVLIQDHPDPAVFAAALAQFRKQEPALDIYPELPLRGKPADFRDQRAWVDWCNSLRPALSVCKAAGATTVIFNGEDEGAATQKAAWSGAADTGRLRGAEFGRFIRQQGFDLGIDAIVEDEDPNAWSGGSHGNAFAPFVIGAKPALLLSGNGTYPRPKDKLKPLRVLPQIWLTRQRFQESKSWDAFAADIRKAILRDGVCVTPEFDGDVLSVLTAPQIGLVRTLLSVL